MHAAETTVRLIGRHFTWPTLAKDVTAAVAACIPCQLHAGHRSRSGLMGHVTGVFPLDVAAMDLVGPLPASNGYTYFIVIIDYFSRFVVVEPLVEATGDAVAAVITRQILLRLGTPRVLVSDGGSHFDNATIRELCEKRGIDHHLTTAYHPESNGTVERAIQTLLRAIKRALGNDTSLWTDVLPYAVWAYNTTPHSSIGMAPYRALFGLEPRTALAAAAGWTPPTLDSPAQISDVVAALRDVVIDRTEAAHRESATRHDATHVPVKFAEGAPVLVHRPALKTDKLSPPFRGPDRVIAQPSPQRVTLQDESSGRVYDAHVDHVRPFVDTLAPTVTERIALHLKRGQHLVEAVEDHRVLTGIAQYLVRWTGYPEPSWEPATGDIRRTTALADYLRAHPDATPYKLTKIADRQRREQLRDRGGKRARSAEERRRTRDAATDVTSTVETAPTPAPAALPSPEQPADTSRARRLAQRLAAQEQRARDIAVATQAAPASESRTRRQRTVRIAGVTTPPNDNG
jgi:transposase InsO family protein